MKRLIFILLLPLLLLTGCDRSKLAQTDSVAVCLATSASYDREQMGLSARVTQDGYPMLFNRFEYLGCRGVTGLFDNDKTLDAQGKAATQVMMSDHKFRLGVQTRMWEAQGKPADIAHSLSKLTNESGDNLVSRAWADSCNRADETVNSGLRDLEAPYLTAYVGTRGWVKDVTEAKILASAIIEQGKSNALIDMAAAHNSCTDPAMIARFQAQVNSLKTFALGQNSDVPGCHVARESDELALKCDDPGKQ